MESLPPEPKQSPKDDAGVPARIGWEVLPLAAVLAASYVVHRVWPFGLVLIAAACTAWLLWRTSHALLPRARPDWLPQAIAAGLWLLYAMQLAYGWRLELGYWQSLGLVFGWAFLNSVFWTVALSWAARRFGNA